jgi:hypothetical protein
MAKGIGVAILHGQAKPPDKYRHQKRAVDFKRFPEME